jgi:5-formyltetrahydrofolate cyclo-ligase
LRSEIAAEDRSLSHSAAPHLLKAISDLPAGIVLLYVPIRGELDPIFALPALIKAGWTLALPRCDRRDGAPMLVSAPAEAVTGTPDDPAWDASKFESDAWGMAVPRLRVPVRPASVTAAIVPGLAFDPTGTRLGRGAGVYDRLLATLPGTARLIGLARHERIVPALPREPHDIPMHAIVTPRGKLAPGA